MRRWRLSRVLAGLGGLALVVGLLPDLFPDLVNLRPPAPFDSERPPDLADLRAPALALAALLFLLAAAARRVLLAEFPAGPVGALLALSLLGSLVLLASGSVGFLRQVRAQAGHTPDQKRAAFLDYQVGLRWAEIEEARRRIPEDGAALLLADRPSRGYPMLLVAYYLEPRRLYTWPSRSTEGRLPPEAWLRSRGITWAVRVSGPGPRRLECWRVAP